MQKQKRLLSILMVLVLLLYTMTIPVGAESVEASKGKIESTDNADFILDIQEGILSDLDDIPQASMISDEESKISIKITELDDFYFDSGDINIMANEVEAEDAMFAASLPDLLERF